MIRIRRIKGADPVSFISNASVTLRFDEAANEFDVRPEHIAIILNTGGFEVVNYDVDIEDKAPKEG